MDPVYLDFHIHTSDDPENLDTNYDIESLIRGIEKIAGDSEYLISLSDHNVINKEAYLKAKGLINNLLLGVEIHIRNFTDSPPYHCHILFELPEITGETIDDLNLILNKLYPKKVISKSDAVPNIHDVLNSFSAFEFLLLPHGGQNHSTFDMSL